MQVSLNFPAKGRRLTAALWSVAMAAGFAVAPTGQANAHYVYEKHEKATFGNGLCINVRSETSHGSNGLGGLFKADATTFGPLFGYNCSVSRSMGIGELKAKNVAMVSKSGQWYHCYTGETYYNKTSTDKIEKWLDFNGATETNGPCGYAYYANFARGYALYSGIWHGGIENSGHHHLRPI